MVKSTRRRYVAKKSISKSKKSTRKSVKKSVRRTRSPERRSMSVPRVCSARRTKAYPNRYLKLELIREAIAYLDNFEYPPRVLAKMTTKELCDLLSSHPSIPDGRRFEYVEVSTGPRRPRARVIPTAGIASNILPDPQCITRSNKKLKPHQKRVVEALQRNRGVIAVHQVGTGKTLTAVTASQCFLDQNPRSKVIVLTPTSLQTNFKKELKAYGADPNDPRYEFYTLQGYVLASKRGETNCMNKMLIVDEAHNLRTAPQVRMNKIVGVMADHVINCAKTAKKVLLLTATPVVNSPDDMASLLAMVEGDEPIKGIRKMIMKDPQSVIDRFRCKISFYDRGTEMDDKYPSRKDRLVPLKMSSSYYKNYMRVQSQELNPYLFDIFKNIYDNTSDLTKFYNGVRRASNNLEQENSPKVNWIMNKINKTSKKHKFVVFSHFIEAGSKLLIKRLTADNVPFAYIDGTMSMKARDQAVSLYNQDKIKVLIISKAGGEGLDLKGTRDIILMEPSWNETTVEQVIGRGIRYESHEHLPPSKRKVAVSRLVMLKPDEYENKRKLFKMTFNEIRPLAEIEPLSVDLYLYKLSQQKQNEINDFIELLKMASIEKNRC